MSAKHRPRAAHAQATGGFRPARPDEIIVRRPIWIDGVRRDNLEAARDFAGEPWARDVRYCGVARQLHVWARPGGGR